MFEELNSYMISKNPTLSDEYFVMIFLSGLKDEIKTLMEMFQPNTLKQASYLARLQKGVVETHHPVL